jgi:hypothetical protein
MPETIAERGLVFTMGQTVTSSFYKIQSIMETRARVVETG